MIYARVDKSRTNFYFIDTEVLTDFFGKKLFGLVFRFFVEVKLNDKSDRSNFVSAVQSNARLKIQDLYVNQNILKN